MRTLVAFLFAVFYITVSAQNIETVRIANWNTLRKSGFYESLSSDIINAPTNDAWLWGINIAHSSNAKINDQPYHYGAQILFPAKGLAEAPEIYVRSMNKEGSGMWAKVILSQGDHAINGKLIAKEIEIKINTGADFVFEPNYNLKPLSEVEDFININKHLPDIPSEKEMLENGLNINEMQIKLLQKIEELTLYVIDLKKENEEQSKRIEKQEETIKNLQSK